MTCQKCPAEAAVHLTEMINGRRRQLHLCVACAQKAGLALPEEPPALGLDAVVQSFIVAHVGEIVGELARRACPLCGIRFMDFRAGGRLGCPNDYQAFETGLTPLLLHSQGMTRHVGKSPRRGSALGGQRLQLRAQLHQAIEREDYESAAKLRDQLREETPR